MNIHMISYIVGLSFGIFLTIQYLLIYFFLFRREDIKKSKRDLIRIILIGVCIILASISGISSLRQTDLFLVRLFYKISIIFGIFILNYFVLLMRHLLITVKDMTFVETDEYNSNSRNYIIAFQIFSFLISVLFMGHGWFYQNDSIFSYIVMSLLILYLLTVIIIESREFKDITGREMGKITRINFIRYLVIFGSGIIAIILTSLEVAVSLSNYSFLLDIYGSPFMGGCCILAIGLSLNMVFEYMDVLSRANETNKKLSEVNRQMMEDVRTAQSLQISLLPLEKQKLIQSYLDMEISYMPMQSVGGDYYDFYKLDDDMVLVFLGDASGHGVYAAMIWAMLKVEVEELIEDKKISDLSQAFTLLNQKITRILENTYSYATLFACLIDLKKHTVSYISAGHTDQLYYKNSDHTVTQIRNKNPIIGTFKTAKFNADTLQAQPGDMILMFSDGIVEGSNPEGEQMERARLSNIFMENAKMGGSASEILSRMLMDFEDFYQGTLQKDDRTVMVIRL